MRVRKKTGKLKVLFIALWDNNWKYDSLFKLMQNNYPKFEDKPWMLSGKHIRQAYMTDLLMALIKDGYEVKASHYQNGWVEFDTNEDYETACEWVKDGSIKKFLG